MYKEIYNENDSVIGLYTGHKVYLPPTERFPIQYLAKETDSDGINAEHIYPRSKGAHEDNGNAYSDLHNMAPVRWEVNKLRANFAFGEVEDNKTNFWLRNNQKISDFNYIDPEIMNEFAEVYKEPEVFKGLFEPRESVKGDVARSVFYFFTMYREEALAADPEYFESMRETLCAWHHMDPADEAEQKRNLQKAIYQDGQPNPFILDCALASRLYCPDYENYGCDNSAVLPAELTLKRNKNAKIVPTVRVLPNPNDGIFTLDISDIDPGYYRMEVFYTSGQLLYSIEEKFDLFNSINMWNAKNGMHYIHMTDLKTGSKYSGTFMVIR